MLFDKAYITSVNLTGAGTALSVTNDASVGGSLNVTGSITGTLSGAARQASSQVAATTAGTTAGNISIRLGCHHTANCTLSNRTWKCIVHK